MNNPTNSRSLFKKVGAYLFLTVSLPILLLYPLLVYGDLMGMGGYDGFASPDMMKKYGVWSITSNVPPITEFIFGGLSIVWFLSLANLLIAILFMLRSFFIRGKHNHVKDANLEQN